MDDGKAGGARLAADFVWCEEMRSALLLGGAAPFVPKRFVSKGCLVGEVVLFESLESGCVR